MESSMVNSHLNYWIITAELDLKKLIYGHNITYVALKICR